jgi:hypothetical protein
MSSRGCGGNISSYGLAIDVLAQAAAGGSTLTPQQLAVTTRDLLVHLECTSSLRRWCWPWPANQPVLRQLRLRLADLGRDR